MKVLLLEDEYALRISVTEFLNDIGYSVDGYGNADAAFEAVYEKHYDLLLLDVNVPGAMNGFGLLKSLREEGNRVPAIFLTSMTTLKDLEEGYESGCCDYIRKPFDLTELQLRIQQAIKSFYHKSEDAVELAEGLVYDTSNYTLTWRDEVISLSKTETEIFKVLLQHRNQVVSVETFQDEIWGEYVDPANVRVQINKLRKKLPVDVIQNRRGLGYILER